MRTSYSALETYKLCPQKYKFAVIDRIPARPNAAAVFGTHIHAALKYMFSKDPLFPTLDEVLNWFRENWPPPEKMEVSPEEKEIYLGEGERMLKNFYAKNAPWNFSVVDLESRFEVLIDDPKRGETHVLAGRIDRIDKTEDGYEIIDYKTARRMPSQDEVDRDLQMSLYSLGLQKRWPHLKPENITLSLHFLKHGEKLSTKRTPESTEATSRDVLKTICEIQKKINAGERFEPAPGAWCGFCPYKPVCPAWRHLYRNQESGIGDQDALDAALNEYFALLKQVGTQEERLGELKTKIRGYMEVAGYDRVFGEDGYISLSRQKRFSYDFEKVHAILEPLGKWDEILTADDKKLKIILKGLPPEIQSQLDDAKILTREFSVLSASMKKIPKPDDLTPPL